MKKSILFFLLLMNVHAFAQYSIVFVHIGKQLPEYVKDAVLQARLFNPSADIFLIHNQDVYMKYDEIQLMKQYEIQHIICEKLPMSKAHQSFKRNSPLAHNGNLDNFWGKTSERFYYLEEFVSAYNLSNVFHLENDVMLYADLSTMLPVFQKYDNIAAAFDADDRCIASLMYFKQPKSLQALINFFAANVSSRLNDMQMPVAFKQKYGRTAIDYLPIIMPEYGTYYPLRNALGKTATNQAAYSHKIEEFGSIFDAAALGQYLGGIDPRNGTSKPGFINETCIFNPAQCSFVWECDEHARKIPYIIFNGIKYRINNLHIHAKCLHAFRSNDCMQLTPSNSFDLM